MWLARDRARLAGLSRTGLELRPSVQPGRPRLPHFLAASG
jgi:hypothetical protein